MRRKRFALFAMPLAGLVTVAGLALHRTADQAEATVALLGAVARVAPVAEVDGVVLTAATGSVTLHLKRTQLGHAPAPTELGIFTVPAGHYKGARLRATGGTLTTTPLDLRLEPGTMQPVLFVLDGARMTAYAGNDHVNEGLLVAAGQLVPVPDVTFTDQQGRQVPFDRLRDRVTVVVALTTHCHESCPLYAQVLSELGRILDARGWRQQVNLVSVTMDPWQDTPPVLAAYAHMVGADWTMLTSAPDTVQSFWSALRANYRRAPYQGAPPTDWYTGRPETYHVDHDSLAVVIDQGGNARFWLMGNPRLSDGLSPPLARLLTPDTSLDALERTASWSPADLLDRIDILLRQPTEAARAPEAMARRGSPDPGFSLRVLGGRTVSLGEQAGRPVLINFWATWCGPCRAELPRLARAASEHRHLRVLAIDEGEQAGEVERYLRETIGTSPALSVLLDVDHAVEQRYQVGGLPVSVFVDARGTVRLVHVGEVDDTTLAAGLRLIGTGAPSG